MKKLWIDMRAYGMRLFMARGQQATDHRIVLAGPGLEKHLQQIESLGFRRDERFKDKMYWTRPLAGMTLGKIAQVFPAGVIGELPVDVIMPQIRAIREQKRQSQIQRAAQGAAQATGGQNEPRATSNAGQPAPARPAGRNVSAGAGAAGEMGQSSPRDAAGAESGPADGVGREERADAVSGAAAGVAQGSSPADGEGLAQGQPAAAGAGIELPGAGSLEQPGEAVREGGAAERPAEDRRGASAAGLTEDEPAPRADELPVDAAIEASTADQQPTEPTAEQDQDAVALVVAGEQSAKTQAEGKALVEAVAQQFGLPPLEWGRGVPPMLAGEWTHADFTRDGKEFSIGVSRAGVIRVDGMSHTPPSMGGEVIANREALLTALTYSLAMKEAVRPHEYASQTDALYRAGKHEQAYAHFMADPRRTISDYYRLYDFIRHREGVDAPGDAASFLRSSEREALAEAGASDEQVDWIARNGGIGKVAPAQPDERASDPLIARMLQNRAEKLEQHFEDAGWETGWVEVGNGTAPIMLWGDENRNHIQVELSAGLNSYVVKAKTSDETALRTVAMGELPFSGRIDRSDWPHELINDFEGIGPNILVDQSAEDDEPEQDSAEPTAQAPDAQELDSTAPTPTQQEPEGQKDPAEPSVTSSNQPGKQPAEQAAPVYVDDEDDAEEIIEREWRGLTAAELKFSYMNADRHAVATESAMSALIKAEGGEPLTAMDRRVLAGFMGWGGVAGALRTDNRKASDNVKGERLANMLGMEVDTFNRHLISNRLESFYTPAPAISAIWSIIQHLGVEPNSRFLEPGSGGGYFYAGAPAEFQAKARFVGVECDEVAVRLANVVAPDVSYVNQRFERAMLDRQFDAVIGNVPFGDTRITDRRYPNATHIHDYFIVRSLDHLKPGGVMAVITSAGTMDKADPGVRKQIMQRANLVGAFRLPTSVFSEQGASVTTDVLVFQRRPEGTEPDYDFTQTTTYKAEHEGAEHEFSINQYFVDNPENVLGKLEAISGPFGPRLATRAPFVYGETSRETVSRIAAQLEERIAVALPAGIRQRTQWPKASAVSAVSASSAGVAARAAGAEASGAGAELDLTSAMYLDSYTGFIGDYTILNDQVVEITDVVNQFDDNGLMIGERYLAQPADVAARHLPMLRAYIEVREAARALMKAQVEGGDEELDEAQVVAQAAYDAFTEKYGPLNTPKNLKVYGDDCGSADVCALEIWDDEREEVKALADAFTQRVIKAESQPQIADATDAFYVCIDKKGEVDFAYMAEISGLSEEQVRQDLIGFKVFLDPATGSYKTDTEYLSGNVVLKLEQAKEAAMLDEALSINVEALTQAQPAPVPFEDITINLGANWIPAEDIRRFTKDLFQVKKLGEADFTAICSREAAMWTVEVSAAFKRDHEANRNTLWGTDKASYESLLEKLLNNQRPTHTYKDPETGKTYTDEEATMRSREKQEQISEKFYQWVANDPERVARYTELYNKSTNVFVIPKPDGSRLTFPGLAASWTPRAHQRDMVAMAMLGYNAMAAHPVGAGKTFEMVAMAIKLKQLGKATKPMIAVPNHMLGQIAREAKQMFPGARVLMVTADDLKGDKRKRFLGVARNNNWDLVVCTHSMLNQISPPAWVTRREFEAQIALIENQIDQVDNSRAERQLAAKLKSVQSAYDDFIKVIDDETRRDSMLTLDKLGVDCVMVDEMHLYKNLELNSNMNVLGVTSSGSKRASNLLGLAEYLRHHWGRSFGLFGFTGTPISNTMCELFVHNKILRPDLLEDMGITHFDEWANRFGSVVSNLEALPEGGGFRVNERFAKFVNLPEMLRLFRSFADVKTKAELNLPTPAVDTQVISIPQTDWQKDFMTHLTIRAMSVRQGSVDPSEDNILSIATAGRKASLDMRLCASILPDDASLKLKEVARNVANEYRDHMGVKGTQLVFMDLGTPGKDKEFVAYEALREEMVALGVPADEVAFIHDAKTNDAKEALFAKVRSGEIRVLLGSTEKMGVGTNVQERLGALHHVDCPWRPSDIEQRKGRIERQGNLFFKEVREYRYTVQDSFDLFMWESNKRKADFINQALADPSSAGREASEEMDLGYAEVLAVTTGNPKIREKVEVDDQVNKLERKYKAWTGERASRMMRERETENRLSSLNQLLAKERQVQSALPKATFKAVTVEGTVHELQDGDTTWLYAKELGAALIARIPAAEARMMKFNEDDRRLGVRVGEIDIRMTRKQYSNKEFEVRGYLDGDRLPMNGTEMSKNNQVMGKAVRAWFDSAERQAKIQAEIQRAERDLEMLKAAGDGAEWPHKADLEVLRERKRELDLYFASQEKSQIPTYDPYLARLATYRAQHQAALEDDQLERFDGGEESRGLLADELSLFPDEDDIGQEAVPEVKQSAGMR